MNIRKIIKEELDWISNISSKEGFNIEDFYDIPFYELGDDGLPKTRRGVPSKFVVKDLGDSAVVNLCRYGDTPGLGSKCFMYGKGVIKQQFSRGDFVFVHEYDKINESTDFDWIRSTETPELGEFFGEDDICFGDWLKGCRVNINDNVITYNLDWDDLPE